jgi:hypothetical protein
VRQLDDKRLHWRAKVAGVEKEWDAEIFEQTPDERIAWRSISGAMNTGQVSFQSLGPGTTRVNLKINYDPDGVVEHLGDKLGVVSMRVSGDLKRFKEFVEKRGGETGSWRGEIHGREVQPEGMTNLERGGRGALNSNMPRSQRLASDEAPSATDRPVANENASGKMG